MGDDGLGGAHDVTHVRVAGLRQGRGDADEDGVDVADSREVRGGLETLAGFHFGDSLVADVLEVRPAGHQGVDLLRVDVETDDVEAGPAEGLGEGQAHVAEPDDADRGLAILNPLRQILHVPDSS
jgi:hypothetical protein